MPPDPNRSTLAIFISEALACAGIPGGTILSELLNDRLRERHQKAQEILLEEIRQGNLTFERADIDPFIDMTLRFIKAIDPELFIRAVGRRDVMRIGSAV